MLGQDDGSAGRRPSRPAGIAAHHPVTRREALQILGIAAAVGCVSPCLSDEPGPDRSEVGAVGDDALDAALRRLQEQEPQSTRGLSTHAPMVAEALCALGYTSHAVQWVDSYRGPMLRLPAPAARIDRRTWRAALGPNPKAESWEAANSRWADWKEFFTAEVAENSWRDVLDRWVGRLTPGVSGAATHGVIRTAHAVRSLAHSETPERRGELVRSLAYWASSYEELPARPGKQARFDEFANALAEVPLYWDAFGKKPEGRNIVEVLRGVHKLDRFGEVRDLMAEPADLPGAISALTATFARVYLRHGTEHDTIAFIHAVTGPASLRRMMPHVRHNTARDALPYAWQAAAAVFSAYARTHDLRRAEDSKLTREELAARAVKNGDEHAIKFTEVMLAEHAANPDPIYLAAAEDVIKRL